MAAANTYCNAWMKSKIGTYCEKKLAHSVQFIAAPSARNALREAAANPRAQAAAARIAVNPERVP